MSFSVFEKIDPSCQNGSMEKAKNIPYHQRPYASIAERTLVDISIYSPRPQIAGTGHSHSKISIHSPRAGRDCRYPNAPLITQISIHSPRMGRDPLLAASHGAGNVISIHSPRMGRDSASVLMWFSPKISIHSPRMGRDDKLSGGDPADGISIHSPRMGRDYRGRQGSHGEWKFQSTLPAWGETVSPTRPWPSREISIHSPRMRRDWPRRCSPSAAFYFNPLSPHGERRGGLMRPVDPIHISIHSPRMGRDVLCFSAQLRTAAFQSTLPAWGETSLKSTSCWTNKISIHSPRMGRDRAIQSGRVMVTNFNPLSPHGERPGDGARGPQAHKFQSTLPAWGETGATSQWRKAP